MTKNKTKIGVVSCSGEDCLGGTISRLATRKMLELRPDETVTICLPLYLAGGEEERGFAQDYPTISVDGCDRYCAKRATEKYSGKVSAFVFCCLLRQAAYRKHLVKRLKRLNKTNQSIILPIKLCVSSVKGIME